MYNLSILNQEKLKSISEKNKSLELDVANGHGEIRKLESLLREKEQQYQFLITEYKYVAFVRFFEFNPKSIFLL